MWEPRVSRQPRASFPRKIKQNNERKKGKAKSGRKWPQNALVAPGWCSCCLLQSRYGADSVVILGKRRVPREPSDTAERLGLNTGQHTSLF